MALAAASASDDAPAPGGAARPFGLLPFTYGVLVAELARYPQIERVVVFGSRARGTHRPGSDVDLCLFGAGVTPALALAVSARLNEVLPLPYFFDVLAYETLANAALRHRIAAEGRALGPPPTAGVPGPEPPPTFAPHHGRPTSDP